MFCVVLLILFLVFFLLCRCCCTGFTTSARPIRTRSWGWCSWSLSSPCSLRPTVSSSACRPTTHTSIRTASASGADVQMQLAPRAVRPMRDLEFSEESQAVIEEAENYQVKFNLDECTDVCVLASLVTPGVGFTFDQLKTLPLTP